MWQRRDQLNRVEFPTRNAFHFMNEIIQASLRQIQEQQGFKIIYACESGSRAWGFSSTDSDYDVRFLYVNPADWYLSVDVEDKPDVFERPITDELDVSGWDLRKALMLLRKSNPPLLEWLNSPIIYLEMIEVVERLRELIPEFYSPIACAYHYLHMAQGNYRDYARGSIVWRKKYLYILRPLLAIGWIEQEEAPVPMEFGKLVNRLISDSGLRRTIDELLEAKKSGKELDRGPAIPELNAFIDSELSRLEMEMPKRVNPRADVERLNEVFRFALRMAW
jgi:predicted nucleotidyltransferase